jgi:hypothetical protein
MNCYIWIQKKIQLFLGKGPPYSQNRVKNFFHTDMKIYGPIESSCRNISKYVVSNIFQQFLAKKILKTVLKYVFIKDVLKKHVFDLKSVKNDRF